MTSITGVDCDLHTDFYLIFVVDPVKPIQPHEELYSGNLKVLKKNVYVS